MSDVRVAVIALYHVGCPNYGNIFQIYACERIYEKMGCEVETIVNEAPFSTLVISKYRGYCLMNFLTGYRLSSKQGLWKKYIFFRAFEKRFLHVSYLRSKKLSDTNYDYYSIGSDQVWNPNWISHPDDMSWFFCRDIPAQKCICLSPSFGVDFIPEERKKEFSQSLGRFDSISVREDAGKRIVKELIGKDAEVLIDPTMALSKAEWNQIQRKPRKINGNTRYILCYFLGGISAERKSVIERYAELSDLRILDVMDESSKSFVCGPSEFMWILAHAEAIFTDSFHGSVFSIIYEKPLFVFQREGTGNYMFSRLDTLLKKFHLEDRIVNDLDRLPSLQDGNYEKAREILRSEQEKLKAYLEKALNRGET